MAQKDGIMFVFELFKYIYSQKSILYNFCVL